LFLSFLGALLDDALLRLQVGGVANVLLACGLIAGLTEVGLGLADSRWFDIVQSILLLALGIAFLSVLGFVAQVARRANPGSGREQIQIVFVGVAIAVAPVTGLVFIPL